MDDVFRYVRWRAVDCAVKAWTRLPLRPRVRHRRGKITFARTHRVRKQACVALQEDYALAWLHHFVWRIRWSTVFAQLAMRPRLARGLLPLLTRWSALVTSAARVSGKIRCAVDAPHTQSRHLATEASLGHRSAQRASDSS